MLGYRSSQHTLMATCFSRVILVVSYIGLYLSWVSPRVLHLWPNYPPPMCSKAMSLKLHNKHPGPSTPGQHAKKLEEMRAALPSASR